MMKKVTGMGRQNHRVEKEALLVAEYYEAQRQMNEGQDRLHTQILTMAEESKKQGFIDGFRLAVRMMKDCD